MIFALPALPALVTNRWHKRLSKYQAIFFLALMITKKKYSRAINFLVLLVTIVSSVLMELFP